MSTRIYSVEGPDEFRLVKASTKQAALRHVAASRYKIDVANQDTLVGAIQDGVQVEVAGDEPAPTAE
jgi:hypothetical protein